MAAVVITGVSRGLGAALFDACNARGDRILAIGRGFTEAQRAIRDERPSEVALHTTDLEDPRWLPDADTFRPFLRDRDDVALIHNAALVTPIGAIGALPEQAMLAAIGVNYTAPILITNSFVRAAPRKARTRILFISSGAATRAIDGMAMYCSTKAGGEMFFNVLAAQFAAEPRVSVANINPGQMDTGMQSEIRGADGHLPEQQLWLDAPAEGRLADPISVANRILKEHLD